MIREAREEDLQLCAWIINDCLMWEDYERTLEDAPTLVINEFHYGAKLWVYEENSTVIGFIGCADSGMMG